MKKFTLLVLVFLMAVVTSFAQNADKKWAIGLGPGIDVNLEDNGTNLLGDVYLSTYLSPSFDLMLDTRLVKFDDGIDLVNPLMNLRYKLSNGSIFDVNSAVQPYIFAGLGYLWDNSAEGVNFDAGVGFKFPVSPSTSLYVAGSYVKGIEGERGVDGSLGTVTDDHFQITSVVEFALGSKDSDGDGVKDKIINLRTGS